MEDALSCQSRKRNRREVTRIAPSDVTSLIKDGDTVALCGSGGGLLEADTLYQSIESSFLNTGHPRNLTLIHALGIGDGKEKGLQRFAHKGLVKRVIGAHWSWSPNMQQLCRENDIEAYTFPAGAVCGLLREIGAGRPGFITKVGLGTFVDPDIDGGKSNAAATENLIEKIELNGESYLFYKAFPVDVSLIRGSVIDLNGNISTHREPTDLDVYTVALAAHNSGGKVIAQVGEDRAVPISPARDVSIPGILVDAVVVEPQQAQCRVADYDPAISGEITANNGQEATSFPLPSGVRRIIAERAKQELGNAYSVNFGFGIPGGIPALLAADGQGDYWGTVEQGIHNGEMLDGEMFGAARYPQAIVNSLEQFDFFTGGGIDVTFLGMGEVDIAGNVNVSKIGRDIVGPGGFIDITAGASKVVFCGTFEAKGLDVSMTDSGQVVINRYGEIPKFVEQVSHITFSGEQALKNGQQVVYVTERAVFELTEHGLTLVEVAPGLSLEKDVLSRLPFTPHILLKECHRA